jgi:hypothetical protein
VRTEEREARLSERTEAAGASNLAGWLLVGLPIAAAVALVPVMAIAGVAQHLGGWSPPVAAGSLAVAAVTAVLVARAVVVRAPPASPPAWAALAVVGIAVLAAAWAAATHGEHVTVRRDAGAYATYALTLANTGGVPIDPGLGVFGLQPGDPFVRVSAAANYQVPVVSAGRVVDLTVVPQFLIGTPSVLTLGWWAAGWTGLFLVPAILGGLALVAFGGLAAQVAGPRVAVLATAALALTQPVLLANRQTYSEPPTLLLLATAGLVSVLALRAERPTAARGLAFLAGALTGAALLVRVDALREMVLLIPVVVVLAILRHPSAAGLAAGLVATGLPAAALATPWSSPYIREIRASVSGLVVAAIALVLVGLVAVLVCRRIERRRVEGLLAIAPGLAAAVVWLVGLVLVSRPLWLVDRREPWLAGAREFVSQLQSSQGLPVDPTRTYAELTVVWVSWWLGPVAVTAAFVAAVVVTRNAVRSLAAGQVPPWFAVFAVGLASTVLTLVRPAITPDHPWADRRLVATALPTLVLLACVAAGWLVERAHRRDRRLATATAVLAGAVLLIPPAVATWPAATTRTEVGQPAAVDAVCAALPANAAILAVDDRSRVEWGPVLRARCDVPVVGLDQPGGDAWSEADLDARIADAVRTTAEGGRTPVLLSATDARIRQRLEVRLGVHWEQVVDLETTEPQRLLVERPGGSRPLDQEVWLAVPGPPG